MASRPPPQCDERQVCFARRFRSAAERPRRMTPRPGSATLCAEVFCMRRIGFYFALGALIVGFSGGTAAQRGAEPAAATPEPNDPVKTFAGRLELEKYKATVKWLTQFGDRRQGTERNRKAVDWIEAQLKSYGCPTDRIKYEYQPNPQTNAGRGGGAAGGRGG